MGHRPGSGRAGKTRTPIGRWSSSVDRHNLLRAGRVLPSTGNAVGSGMINPYNTGGRRITDGLMSIWWFTEGTGTVIKDRAGLTNNTDLNILSGTSWTQDASYGNRYFLNLSAGGHVQASTDELYNAMQAKVTATIMNEFTLEAWVKPTNVSQDGPARIMTLAQPANGTKSANFMIGQGSWGSLDADVYNTRLRVEPSGTDADGDDYKTAAGTATTSLQHLVYTVQGGDDTGQYLKTKLYVDGVEKQDNDIQYYGSDTSANFLRWWSPAFNLDIGNTIGSDGSDRQWLGGIYLMSMYTRALTAGEVVVNYAAGVTTDSVLPTPTVIMDTPLTSSGWADGTEMSCKYSVGGIRSVDVEVTYIVSSAEGLVEDTDYQVVTDKTQTLGKDEYESTITLKPLVNLSPEGTVDITLSTISVGSIGAASAHTMSFSSMASAVSVSFDGSNVNMNAGTGTYPVLFDIGASGTGGGGSPRKSDQVIDVCCVGMSSTDNSGVYYMVDANDGTLKSFDGASPAMAKIPSGTMGPVVGFNLSADPTKGFYPGDKVYLSALAASSISGTDFHYIIAPSAMSATVDNIIDTERPNEYNTGPIALGITRAMCTSPDESTDSWWNADKGAVDEDGAFIYKKNFGRMSIRADNVTFSGCYFSGTGSTNTMNVIKGASMVLTGAKDHTPSGITLAYCEIEDDPMNAWDPTDSATSSSYPPNMISQGGYHKVHRCHAHHAAGDCMTFGVGTADSDWPGIAKTDVTCIVSDNYIHHCCGGNKPGKHGDGFQSTGSTSGMWVVSGNYVNMPKASLFKDGGKAGDKICNCYSPQDNPLPGKASWSSNQCIRLMADCGVCDTSDRWIGHVYVCDNWVNGGNLVIAAGPKNGPGEQGPYDDTVGDITIERNKLGRDHYFGFADTGKGTKTGTTSMKDNVWMDDGTPIGQDGAGAQSDSNSPYTRYRCVTETGYCPQSTWNCDAIDPCDCSSGLFCI